MRFLERNCDFLSKTAKSSNFTLQCDWKSKKSQNFLVFGAFKKNRWIFFEKILIFFEKTLVFQEMLKIMNLLYNATELVKFLKEFKTYVFVENKSDALSEEIFLSKIAATNLQ